MVKYILIISVFVCNTVCAQNDNFKESESAFRPGYRVPGLFAASATFTPGFMLNSDNFNYYLSAFGEYHLDRKVSLRSDNYLILNGTSDDSFDDFAIFRTYFGAFYHFNAAPTGNWDVKLGFQPGITYMERATQLGFLQVRNASLVPSFSVSVGFDYYVWKYFHFFTQLAYVNSTMRDLPGGSEKTDELLFSAGLGFQIRTKRNQGIKRTLDSVPTTNP